MVHPHSARADDSQDQRVAHSRMGRSGPDRKNCGPHSGLLKEFSPIVVGHHFKIRYTYGYRYASPALQLTAAMIGMTML